MFIDEVCVCPTRCHDYARVLHDLPLKARELWLIDFADYQRWYVLDVVSYEQYVQSWVKARGNGLKRYRQTIDRERCNLFHRLAM